MAKQYYSPRSFENDLESDPDFDLDEYIREQSQDFGESQTSRFDHSEDQNYRLKNSLLIAVMIAAFFLWYHDWSPSQALSSIFGSTTTQRVSSTTPDINISIPDIPEINIDLPELAPMPPMEGDAGFADFMNAAREAGISENYSNTALQAFYQTNVPVDYIQKFINNEYQYFSYSAIIGFYHGGVTLEYLDQLNTSGYLEKFSYSAIIGMYNGGVTVDYLDQLSSNDYLDQFSYSAIIGLYNGGVTLDYLNQLKERDLLKNMSYSDIIMAYNTDQ